MNQFEIISTHDKGARDQIFAELRHSDLPNERQAIRFGDVEPILNGLPHGEIDLDSKGRVRYRSVWSVGYPRNEESDETKTRRREQKDRKERNAKSRIKIGNYIDDSRK